MNIMELLKNMRAPFIVACLIAFTFNVFAQQTPITVRGKVIDKADKLPIIGASITILDKDNRYVSGTSSDLEGNYAIKVNNGTFRIAISFLGYLSTKPLVIGDKTVYNFQLETTLNQLLDVVVTAKPQTDNGTGLNIDRVRSTTAVSTIQAKELEEMQSSSIDQALQGRLSGLDITASSGDPGAPLQIRIRGTSSLNGATDPLIVVDGLPYEITIPSDFNFATSDDNAYGQLLNIAPSDIKDISVLKDAAATAVWGSRAANGVLVINTKRGQVGPPTIGYAFKGSFSRQPGAVPLLNGDQYSTLLLEEFYNAGRQFSASENAKQFQYDPNDPYNFYNFSNNTDWVGAITQDGYIQDHNVQIQGGGQKAQYLASLGYNGQQGTTKGTDLKRINSRINLDYRVSDKIKFRSDIAYTHIDNNNLYSTNVRDVAYRKLPNQSIYEYDEYGKLSGNYFSPLSTAQGSYSGTYNPLAFASEALNHQLGDRVLTKFQLRYDFIPGIFTSTGDLQFDVNNNKVKTFLPKIATGLLSTDNAVNRASDSDIDQFGVTSKVNFLFTPKLPENHSLSTLLSFQSFAGRYTIQGLTSSNSASSYFDDPSISARTNLSGSAISSVTESRSVGALFNAYYIYKDRYIFNASVRADGNSKFGPNNRYGVFPAGSVAWRISQEPFMKNVKAINEFKLRASYGLSGNAPRSDYSFFNIYQNYGNSYLGETGVYSSNVELSDLRFEKVTQSNFGLDISLLNSRINSTVEVYRKRTTDLFFNDLQVASYNGFSGVDANTGTLDNQGWEFSLDVNPVRSKKWRLDLNFNIAHNENLIREISRLYPRESARSVTTNKVYKTYFQENNPFGSFYGFKYLGVYSNTEATVAKDKNGQPIISPNGDKVYMRFAYPTIDYQFKSGDAMYEDINHDGVIDYKDVVYLGNSNPKLTGGFGSTVAYNNRIKFSLFFSFRQGSDIINGTKMNTTDQIGYNNQSTAVLRRWRNEGDVTDIPRAVFGTGYNSLGSSRYVEDASFLRLRALTIRYDFAKPILDKLKLKGLGLYMTGENLLTFTHYTGQDPEVALRIKDAFSTLVDYSMTPPIKTFTFGLSARF